MSISQKTAWIQLIIFAVLIVAWAALFAIKGTIYYWEDEGMKNIFYYLSAGAFAVLVGMNTTVTLATRGRTNLSDERDRTIFRKASLWATGVSYTVVAGLMLATAIAFMSRGLASIPVYFPLFIVVVGGALLLLVQGLVAVILYERKVHHAGN
jgi:hypothetical protein